MRISSKDGVLHIRDIEVVCFDHIKRGQALRQLCTWKEDVHIRPKFIKYGSNLLLGKVVDENVHGLGFFTIVLSRR